MLYLYILILDSCIQLSYLECQLVNVYLDAELKLFSATAHMHHSKDRKQFFLLFIYLLNHYVCDASSIVAFFQGGGTGVAGVWRVGSLTCHKEGSKRGVGGARRQKYWEDVSVSILYVI